MKRIILTIILLASPPVLAETHLQQLAETVANHIQKNLPTADTHKTLEAAWADGNYVYLRHRFRRPQGSLADNAKKWDTSVQALKSEAQTRSIKALCKEPNIEKIFAQGVYIKEIYVTSGGKKYMEWEIKTCNAEFHSTTETEPWGKKPEEASPEMELKVVGGYNSRQEPSHWNPVQSLGFFASIAVGWDNAVTTASLRWQALFDFDRQEVSTEEMLEFLEGTDMPVPTTPQTRRELERALVRHEQNKWAAQYDTNPIGELVGYMLIYLFPLFIFIVIWRLFRTQKMVAKK